MTGGIGTALADLVRQGALDILVSAQCGESARGELLWSEPLVWAFPERCLLNPAEPLPIAFLSEPCPYRDAGLLALAGHRRKWRVVLTAHSTGALVDAVVAGFAVTPMTPSTLPPGLKAVPTGDILPELPHAQFTLQPRAGSLGDTATELMDELRHACHVWLGARQASRSRP